jgi:hypothetical protein
MTTPDEPPSFEPAIQDMLAQYAKAEQDRLDAMKHTLKADILPQFAALKVANIEVSYSGYGDSGAIDGCQYRDSAGTRVDRTTIPTQLIESLESCVYEFLPAGFEINDGGQGTVTIDVPKCTVTIAHQENYTDSRDSTREITL